MIDRGIDVYITSSGQEAIVVLCENKKFHACTMPGFPVYFTDEPTVMDGVNDAI